MTAAVDGGPEAHAQDRHLAPVPDQPGTELAIPALPPRRASLRERVAYATELSRSNLLPEQFRGRPANVLWAMEYGDALRLPTIATIMGVNVMDGKPAPNAALVSALVRREHHRCRIGYTHDPDGPGGFGTGWCEITRADDPGYTYRAEWTVADAVRAQLCTIKDGRPFSRTKKGLPNQWEKYTRNMLKWRAATECARDACEEALMGLHYTAEELGADVDEDGNVIMDAEVVEQDDRPDYVTADQIDAEVAKVANDRDGLTALWKRTEPESPERDKVKAAVIAFSAREKAARDAAAQATATVVDAEVVDTPAGSVEPPPMRYGFDDGDVEDAGVDDPLFTRATGRSARNPASRATDTAPDESATRAKAAALFARLIACDTPEDVEKLGKWEIIGYPAADVDVSGLLTADARDVLALAEGFVSLSSVLAALWKYTDKHHVSPAEAVAEPPPPVTGAKLDKAIADAVAAQEKKLAGAMGLHGDTVSRQELRNWERDCGVPGMDG